MRITHIIPLCLAVWLLMPAPATAGENLTGVWEFSSLGTFRRVEIWTDGDNFVAYRVMYPVFEGEKYKLEHLFRGTIKGDQIKGDLLVKEEGMKNFDNLRSFVGKISSAKEVHLDGGILKRQAEALKSKPPRLKPRKKRSRRGVKSAALFPHCIRPALFCKEVLI